MNRQLLSHGLIIVALCVGAWMFLVEPGARELSKLEEKIDSVSGESTPLSDVAIHTAAERVNRLRGRIDEIETMNVQASDTSQLCGRVLQIARATGVRVLNVNPDTKSVKGDATPDVGVVSLEVTLEGTYPGVAEFVEAVDRELPFLRSTSFMLTPLQGQEKAAVQVRMTCEALSFKVPEELTAVWEGDT